MKKLFIIIMIVVLVVTLAGCGNKKDPNTASVKVDKSSQTVDVTLPAFYFEVGNYAMWGFFPAVSYGDDLTSFITDLGAMSANWNDNGSLTMTMTQKWYDEVLKEIAQRDRRTIDMYLSEDCVYDIETSKDYATVTVWLDMSEQQPDYFEGELMNFASTFMMSQSFIGIKPHVEFTSIDVNTGDVIDTFTFPDYWIEQYENWLALG
jgi:uncharacterized lipoprotein NlpE involved in copper resistance